MKQNEFLYGTHPVMEALQAKRRRINALFLDAKKREGQLSQFRRLADMEKIPVKTLAEQKLRDYAQNSHHQGVVAEVGPYPLVTMDQLIDMENVTAEAPFFLITDQIVDPQNLGALMRTALAAGVHGIITPKDRSARPTPTVSKTSAGAMEHIRLAQVTNLSRTLQDLKKKDIWIYGLDQTAEATIYSTSWTGPCALVVGSEGKGIRPLVKKTCDQLVTIPQQGPVSSLNASVAGAVALYEAFRQRHLQGRKHT
jgi:23S rRNA (guanosine2251-2'-O)-methyltransferase